MTRALLVILVFAVGIHPAWGYTLFATEGGINHPVNMSELIQPDSPLVQKMADKLYIDEDGVIRYIDTGRMLDDTYAYDGVLFDLSGPVIDYWQTAEEYISRNLTGDCEDRSIFLMSALLSGNMSVLENGTLVKKRVPVEMFLGTAGGSTDAWIRYVANGTAYLTSAGPWITIYQKEDDDDGYFQPELVYRYGNQTFRPLNPIPTPTPTPEPTPAWPKYLPVD